MTDWLVDRLLRLAPRERRLLGLLVIVVLPLGVVLGGLLPLRDARDSALDARTDALALNIWVQERAAEAQTLASLPRTGTFVPIGTSGIEQALIDAGLRAAVTELSSDGDGVVSLRFDDVGFARLADWLSEADPVWGYDIALFRMEAAERSGNVTAALTLMPIGG